MLHFVHKDADILQAPVYQRWQLGTLKYLCITCMLVPIHRPQSSLLQSFSARLWQYVRYGSSTVRCGEVRYGTVRFGTVRYGTVRCGAVRCGTVRYGTVRCGTVRYGTVRYGAVRY